MDGLKLDDIIEAGERLPGIAALKSRPEFLPLMRLVDGLVEYKEATGTLATH